MENITGQLRMEQISKSFGPVQALQNVTFCAKPGTVHALCGENGAGKSTLMKILAGVHTPDSGNIYIDDQQKTFTNPKHALDSGISMLYQELDLAEDLTVYENIYLGKEIQSSIPFLINRDAEIKNTADLCNKYGFTINPNSTIRDLSVGDCQIVELLKALIHKAKIIIMDEPTSSLPEAEAQRLFKIVRQLCDRGMTIIYISHRMEEVMSLADEISVLRDGEIVTTVNAKDIDVDTVVKHMVGRELKDFYPARESNPGEILFEADNLATEEGIHDISFNVRRGEVVGMAGLVGSGRTEVARAIFGIEPLVKGSLKISGQSINIKHPRDAIEHRIALLTEDRKRTGLCTNLPCSWNMTLSNYNEIGMKYLLNFNKENQLCQKFGQKVSVKWLSSQSLANSLSGGNQQKLLLGRWLMADSEFIIFDEPTRGIDVGAKKEVYLLLNELVNQGKAILIISSELPELFGVTDRILVIRRGRMVGDFVTKQTTPEHVMHLAAVENANE
ncbi:MAG: sugar ABC transporter ATP-binding protein [Sedimentisphaerales bacterium]|nr:sugar ABC transporter ATP-binding protein [Sedimentisphaerales bacterium]